MEFSFLCCTTLYAGRTLTLEYIYSLTCRKVRSFTFIFNQPDSLAKYKFCGFETVGVEGNLQAEADIMHVCTEINPSVLNGVYSQVNIFYSGLLAGKRK